MCPLSCNRAPTGARKPLETYKIWGLIAILVHFAALVVGMVAIYPHSMMHFWIYVGIVVVSTFGIIFSFCSKCPCHKHQCSHIVLGPLTRLLPLRKVSKYTTADYWGLGLSYLVGIVYPEYWLWKSPVLPFVFYPLVVATLALILLLVCPYCRNCNCPFNRHPKNPKYRKLPVSGH